SLIHILSPASLILPLRPSASAPIPSTLHSASLVMPKAKRTKSGSVRRRTPTTSPTRPPAEDISIVGSNFPKNTSFLVEHVTGSLVDPETGEKKLLVRWQDSFEPVEYFQDSGYALRLHTAMERRQAAERRLALFELAERQRITGVATAAINAANDLLRHTASLQPPPPPTPSLNKRSATGKTRLPPGGDVPTIGDDSLAVNFAEKLQRKASAEPTIPDQTIPDQSHQTQHAGPSRPLQSIVPHQPRRSRRTACSPIPPDDTSPFLSDEPPTTSTATRDLSINHLLVL
ncbi:hypothetical protein V8E36_003835, partial [Tilletia maclaganii]